MFLSFFFSFHPWRWNFFDEKDLKKRRRGVNNRASSEKSPRFREKKTTNDVKICRFLSTFFLMKIHIFKKKKNNNLFYFPPSSIYQSIDRMMKAFYDVVQTLSVSHAVVQIDHFLSYRWITSCRTDGSLPVVQMVHFLSYDLATYLNCFLMAFPSISTNLKVLVAEVESPRHLVGFHRPGAFQTVFRLGALTFSTDFLTASRRAKSAE